MPKKQPTAAKRARAAARQGAKYTEALRAERGDAEGQDHGAGDALAERLAEILRRWREANDAAANANQAEDDGQPYDPYAAAHAMTARGNAADELARVLAAAAREGRTVTLGADALEVLALAARRAGALDEMDAARHRIEWGVPTITPGAEVAKLRLIRCEACGQYWRPDNRGYCTQCPRLWHGPTPRDRAEAEALRPHRILLTPDDLADRAPIPDED